MSGDGRLDLDDLGQVIDEATTLDEIVGEDAAPTWGERLEAAGVTPWLRRHRVALGSAAVVAVAVAGVAWVRHDPRPPDDGSIAVALVDGTTDGSGVSDQTGNGVVSATYTLVRQRPGDTVTLLGIDGPGIRATSVGRAISDSNDADRSSTPVLAVLDCDDPAALTPRDDQYRLIVSRTDSYGRTVRGLVPLPLGTNLPWAGIVGGTCLQNLANAGISVESVRATVVPQKSEVLLDLGLRSSLDVGVAVDVQGYAGMQVRPLTTSTILPGGGTGSLRIVESIADCSSPHIGGALPAPNGQYGIGVTDRTTDVFLRVQSQSDAAPASASATLHWSVADGRRVSAALEAACAGLPSTVIRVLSSGPAPENVRRAAAAQRGGDTSTGVVRSVVDVRTTATGAAVADIQLPADLEQGNVVTITPYSARSVDGVARLTVDWTTSCGGGWSPPTARLLLTRDGRTWSQWLNLDDLTVAAGLLRTCPGTTHAELADNGWQSVVRNGSS